MKERRRQEQGSVHTTGQSSTRTRGFVPFSLFSLVVTRKHSGGSYLNPPKGPRRAMVRHFFAWPRLKDQQPPVPVWKTNAQGSPAHSQEGALQSHGLYLCFAVFALSLKASSLCPWQSRWGCRLRPPCIMHSSSHPGGPFQSIPVQSHKAGRRQALRALFCPAQKRTCPPLASQQPIQGSSVAHLPLATTCSFPGWKRQYRSSLKK